MAFTTFMALGAWRLMKMGIVVKQMKTVETLGSASVICTDKTGTLTENRMALAKVYTLEPNQIVNAEDTLGKPEKELITWPCGRVNPSLSTLWKLPCMRPFQK